ncbi:TIR domain-containing protein [Nostoc sp. FACHB-152]|uniref:TIR domain-containing protein n=1 Tax=unclassified Nostoc TaxID=2593658 RepID=UPI001682B62D|nr:MULTISPECIES: TIR domain-containing protein [unclassified Nostoc]MBD2451746.1 TIR domain-containing protein [Nostoc sp. FACHB-152]MBD2472333.1 TIR domain-containing protein [Nostoc sp. FACHB-145]
MTKFCDAFISYGRADSKAFATKLQARLVEQGLKVWFDFNDIPLGVDFQNQIDDGIEKSHHFVFIIAPHSVNSAYCRKEIELAIKLNKRIIPLLHVMQISRETWQQRNPNGTDDNWEAYQAKGLNDSYQNMHPKISSLNWVYFQDDKDDFEKSLADLTTLLHSHTDYVEPHTRFLTKALEWQRYQKQTSNLLVGEEIQQAQSWLKKRFKDEQPPCIPSDLHGEYITQSIKNANNLMTQVFLSYSNQDRAVMEKIRNSLQRESITVWTNTTDIKTGEEFHEAIKRGIEQADNIVYLLSPDAVNSTYCQQELDLAVTLNKRIIPLLVQETDLMQVPSALRNLQYIDLTDNEKEDDYFLDQSQLINILHQDAAYYTEHKILLTKALNWQRQQNNPSILLRGFNLQSAATWLKVAQKRTDHPPTPLQQEFITESLEQPPLESIDVFISYSRADADLARKLNDALQLQGKTTWFDQESIPSGSDFKEEIYRGINTSDNFIFIISPRSINSPYCQSEVEYASSLNKRFVTVLHREINTAELHPDLAKVQWIDFNQNSRDFNTNFNQLIRTIDTDREHVHSHSKWLKRALEWEQNGKNDDLLLRGSEFLIAQNWLETTEQENKKPAATSLHKAFLEVSKNAIEAAKEEEKRRQAEMLRLQSERAKEAEARLAEQKKSAKRQKFFLAAISMALVAAVGFSIQASVESAKAKKAQNEQLDSGSLSAILLSQQNLQFDALRGAMNAGRILKSVGKKTTSSAIQNQILTALQAAVYGDGFREQNRLKGHDGTVFSVSFSPDDQIIASASGDGTIRFWSFKDEIKPIPLIKVGTDVYSVSFSPDGNIIASGDKKNTVKLWSKEGKLLQDLKGHTGSIKSVVWSPDGNTIASGSDDKTVRLWNKQGKLIEILKGHNNTVTSVSFSPDGKTIATASKDGKIILWSKKGEQFNFPKTLNCCQEDVNSVSLSPDKKAIASGHEDNTVKLPQGVNSVSFSLDGNTIASASDDNTVKLWRKDGKLLVNLEGHNDRVRSVVWSPNGNTIASASDDKTVKLWRSKDGKLLQTFIGHNAAIRSVSFSHDGQAIATTSEDNTIRLWRESLHKLHIQGPKNKSIDWSLYKNTVASHNVQKQIVEICTKLGECTMTQEFSPDENTIACASKDDIIKLWNEQSQKFKTLGEHTSEITSISFSPDCKTLVSGSDDNTIKLWSLEKKSEKPKTLRGHTGDVLSVTFSPDGKTIASGSKDNTIKLWNNNGKPRQTLIGHHKRVTSVRFSLDSKTLLSTSSNGEEVIEWKLADFQLDKLIEDACTQMEDYLKYHADDSDRNLCK